MTVAWLYNGIYRFFEEAGSPETEDRRWKVEVIVGL